MSIEKFIAFFTKNKGFFVVIKRENSYFCTKMFKKQGFWVFESIIAVLIFSIMSFLICKFICNLYFTEGQSIARLKALNIIISKIESENISENINLLNDGIKNNGYFNNSDFIKDKKYNFEAKIMNEKIKVSKNNISKNFFDQSGENRGVSNFDDLEILGVKVSLPGGGFKLFFYNNGNNY